MVEARDVPPETWLVPCLWWLRVQEQHALPGLLSAGTATTGRGPSTSLGRGRWCTLHRRIVKTVELHQLTQSLDLFSNYRSRNLFLASALNVAHHFGVEPSVFLHQLQQHLHRFLLALDN